MNENIFCNIKYIFLDSQIYLTKTYTKGKKYIGAFTEDDMISHENSKFKINNNKTCF